MKTITKTLPWVVLLLAHVDAQDTTSDGNYVSDGGDDVVTSYYTLCPNSTTSSSVSSGTLTADPGQLSKTGDDGRITIYRTETTIFPHICPDGYGICGATYVLSEECPCTAGLKTVWEQDKCPEGFTTTVAECTVCASNGGPATVTLTVPADNGPYASVTPKYGSPVNNPDDICTENTPEETGIPENNPPKNPPAVPTSSDNTGSNGDESSWDNPADRYDNTTKPYTPYTGAAGRLNIGMEGSLSIIGAGLIGALAILL